MACRGVVRSADAWFCRERPASPFGLRRGRPRSPLRSERSLAEGAGTAPAPAVAGPVFETGAASLYLPAFRK
jgi:hypothetical protein